MRWLEVATHSVLFHATPLNAGELFARQIEDDARAWIFTSATLSVRKDLHHYLHEIGLQMRKPLSGTVPSIMRPKPCCTCRKPCRTRTHRAIPRRWSKQGRRSFLVASGGGAFMLFTSLRAMNEAHRLLQARMAETGVQFPLLLQGDKSRTDLLDEFRQLGNAVLLGSQSFWEGVDVAGNALSLVVIDRLPFQPPDDPVLAARMEAMKRAGRNPFFDYPVAARRDQPEARRGAFDPARKRSRRIDDLRPASGSKNLWTAHLAGIAADETLAQTRRCRGVFRNGSGRRRTLKQPRPNPGRTALGSV